MRHIAQTLFIGCIAVSLFSCEKKHIQKSQPVAGNYVPVSWYLSNPDKALFNTFLANLTMQFADQNNNIVVFKANGIQNLSTCLENKQDKGEALLVQYNCQTTNYFYDYWFSCRLSARQDNRTELIVTFGADISGNPYDGYIRSLFCFVPNEATSLNTTNSLGYELKQTFLSSVELRGTTFNNVFLIERELSPNNQPMLTSKCYYTVEQGIIAFEHNDDRLWIRQ